MHAVTRLSVFVAASLAIAGVANAAPLSAAEILGDFNGVVFGNFSTSSDVEGALVVGGNLDAGPTGPGNLYNHPRTTAIPGGFSSVTVYGNASGIYHINNSGTVDVGGSDTANFNPTVPSDAVPGSGNMSVDFAAVGTGTDGIAALFGAMTANNTVTFPTGPANQFQFNGSSTATVDGAKIDVFSITASQLAGLSSFDVNVPDGYTAVFNVDGGGGAVTLGGNYLNEANNVRNGANNVVWNFLNTTSLDFTTQWGGLILAPEADVTNSNPIEGVLVAGNYNPTSELHDYAFDGVLPPSPSEPHVAVPEPSVLGMFGLGLGLLCLGLARDRRRLRKVGAYIAARRCGHCGAARRGWRRSAVELFSGQGSWAGTAAVPAPRAAGDPRNA